jgi:hypothetical protein
MRETWARMRCKITRTLSQGQEELSASGNLAKVFDTISSPGYTEGSKKKYVHFNVQNICLNNLLVYLWFNFENDSR